MCNINCSIGRLTIVMNSLMKSIWIPIVQKLIQKIQMIMCYTGSYNFGERSIELKLTLLFFVFCFCSVI